jgi:hypothetical protein
MSPHDPGHATSLYPITNNMPSDAPQPLQNHDVRGAPSPKSIFHTMHLYDLLPSQHEYDTTMRAGVFYTNHLFPPLVLHNSNIFDQSFGIEFDCMDARLV